MLSLSGCCYALDLCAHGARGPGLWQRWPDCRPFSLKRRRTSPCWPGGPPCRGVWRARDTRRVAPVSRSWAVRRGGPYAGLECESCAGRWDSPVQPGEKRPRWGSAGGRWPSTKGPDGAPHSHEVRRESRFVEPSGSPLSGGCLLGLLRAAPNTGLASAVTLSEAGQRVSAQTVWDRPGNRERRELNPQIGLHLGLPCHWASLPRSPRHRARAWVLRCCGTRACWTRGGPAYAVTRQARDDRPGWIGDLFVSCQRKHPARASRR